MSKALRRGTLAFAIGLSLALVVPAVAAATPAPVFSSRWGVSGSGTGDFIAPNLIAADRLGHVYVADAGNNRIQRFTSAGAFGTSWNNNGTTTMDYPAGVATDRFERVYVSEVGGHRVDRYDGDGGHQLSIGLGSGTGPGQFGTAFGIAVDPWGFVYVGDQSLNRVQKFAPSGTYISQLAATGPGALNGPSGIALDPLGDIFVADTFNNRVVEFGPTGLFVRAFGSLGSGAGQLNSPRGLAFAPDGNLLVGDQNNARVEAFSPTGAYQYSFGHGGAPSEQIAGAFGVATDGSGIFVSDMGDYSMKKFTFGAPKPVARIKAVNRYGLAVSVAAARWPHYKGMHHVIIVNGENSAVADALAVSPMAGVYNAPILLTTKAKLSAETNTVLKKMRSASGKLAVHVIGDTKIISKTTYNTIKADNRGGSTERINGHDPYVLSLAIARRVKSVTDSRGTSSNWVLVFNAQNPAAVFDALVAGPGAARSGIPMLAVKNSSVPTAIHNALVTTFAGKQKVAVNSAAYLSASLYSQISGAHRLSNHSDRAASAADIALVSRDGAFTSWDSVGAVGTVPAAIAAGPYMGLQDGVLLYTPRSVWPTPNTSFFTFANAHASVLRGIVIGSTNDVSDSTKAHFSADLNTP